MLSVHAKPEACHGNSDLGGCDVSVLPSGIFENARYALRQTASLAGLVLDARPRRADDGKLRCDKQAVGDHQQEDDAGCDQQFGHSSVLVSSGTTRRARTESRARSATRSTSNS